MSDYGDELYLKEFNELFNKEYGKKDFNKKLNKLKKKHDDRINPKKEIIHKSFYNDDEFIYEQIYNNNISRFVRYNKSLKDIDYVEEIHTPFNIIKPLEGDELDIKSVILPKDYKKYDSIIKLDEDIRNFIHKWLDVDDTYLKFVAWNVRFSWVFDLFHTLNYTRALGDTGTGKSRFLDTIGMISYKPMMVSGALTPAPLFRIINKWKGTLLIDEGDQKSSEESDAFIKILNCGYEKGRNVMRCDKNDPSKLEFFDVYCPKVITTRRRFEDKATEARCMTKIMTQTGRKNIPDILTKSFFTEAEDLRQQLLYYRLTNYHNIDPEAGLKVDLSTFEPRLRQVNRGFMGMFCNDDEQIKEFKEFLAHYQSQIIEERSESFDGLIVRSIADLIVLDHEVITPKDIAEYLNNNYPSRYEANSRNIGKHCKALGINFKREKVFGKTENNLQQNNKSVLNVIFSRYLLDNDIITKINEKGYEVTKVTLVMLTYESSKKGKNYQNEGNGSVPVTNVTNVTNVTKHNQDPSQIGEEALHLSDYLLDEDI